MKNALKSSILAAVVLITGSACRETAVSVSHEECRPKTCAELSAACGEVDDGCHHIIDCGTCPEPCTPHTCADLEYECGKISDGCGRTMDCGNCNGDLSCVANQCGPAPLPYPVRKNIKGLNNDIEAPDLLIENNGGVTSINFIWENWQPIKTSECTEGQVKYDGFCFTPDERLVSQVKQYTEAGVVVTGIFYGVPEWARRECREDAVYLPIFCAPTATATADFARFTGFLARYFNGHNDHGRVADFVIHNEVNSTEWFNPGCYSVGCNVETMTSVYAENFNMAYDRIMREQPYAKVLISLMHAFGPENDLYTMFMVAKPYVSAITYLKSLLPKLGDRTWRIAFHPYPPEIGKPEFSADDYPRVTFGNIGILAGWLRQNYPDRPEAWEIQLTEQGISGFPEQRETQAQYLCQAFRNILGTPGIESFIYNHVRNYPFEEDTGLSLGLLGAEPGDIKPAWFVWALANQNRAEYGYPSCGFELDNGQQIKLTRGFNNNTGYHWITSRMLPNGFTEEMHWKLLREPAEKTALLYECRIDASGRNDAKGQHTMASLDPQCAGHFSMGPMGYLFTEPQADTMPLYNCLIQRSGDHFVFGDPACDGHVNQGLLGYALHQPAGEP